jgi:predicted outer membrane protein
MVTQYGLPQEATSEQLIWHHIGPFKRITVTRAEHHHDFPFPHTDYLEHTIEYAVPVDKAAALSAYDASLTFDRTRGEMSARCDLEGHNVLTLNLAHEIVTGAKNTEEARAAFSQIILEDWQGSHPPYTEALQFEPSRTSAAFSDVPTIPGSPKRAATLDPTAALSKDAEILAMVVAADLNEILAALQTSKKQVGPEVMNYATMLHKEHGTNLHETLALGQRIDMTPIVTDSVDELLIKGARDLARLVPLEGERYGRAYLKAMIAGHQEVLDMIDNRLCEQAENEAVKNHLIQTRGHVAMHLEQAKELEATETVGH